MKFKIGDRVRFLNETGGGKITRMDDRGYIYVMTGDGFEIPVLAGELILQSPSAAIPDINFVTDSGIAVADQTKFQPPAFSDKSDMMTPQLPVNIRANAQFKLLLGLVPENIDAVFKATINCYLINDSEFFVYYMVGYQQEGRFFYLKSGEIEPDTKCFLADFDQTRLSRIALFHIQTLAVGTGQYFKRAPRDDEIDISRYDFLKYNTYKANEYFDEKALILEKSRPKMDADASVPDSGDKSGGVLQENKSGKRPAESMEIDLHIEALREEYAQLSHGEILRIQMNRFRSALEDALSKKVRRIVFIHGVGNGTLKLELRNELKRNYPEFTYQDASFKEYGFGATLVHLR